MLRLIAVAVLACFAATAADARPKQARHESAALAHCRDGTYRPSCIPGQIERIQSHATAYSDANGNAISNREADAANRRGYCRVDTAAGQIIVACGIADRMRGFIADVVDRGFKGRVHCFATGGHVRNSLHYRAEACDFAQRGWGKTVRPMYHIADLAVKWGLRDGCTFRDCGHVDSGRGVASVPWPARMAEMKARVVRR